MPGPDAFFNICPLIPSAPVTRAYAPSEFVAQLTNRVGADALAGIRLDVQRSSVTVVFSHPYLESYWRHHYLEKVTQAVHEILGPQTSLQCCRASTQSTNAPPPLQPPDDAFEDIIVGDGNRMALAAIKALCQPAPPRHCLLLVGPTGSGKSHLMAALGNAWRRSHLVGDFTQTNGAEWTCPCLGHLLLDDVHLVRPKYYDALVRKLEVSQDSGGVLVISCLVTALEDLSVRVRQRLQSFLQVELTVADLPMRIRWLERQNDIRGLGLQRIQINALARYGRSILHLQGLLQKFEFYVTLSDRSLAWDKIEKITSPAQSQPCLALVAHVARRLGVTQRDIMGASRRQEIAFARQVAMYLCRQQLGLSYPELGRLFGGRDHSTVIHSIRKVEKLQADDKDLHNLLTELAMDAPS